MTSIVLIVVVAVVLVATMVFFLRSVTEEMRKNRDFFDQTLSRNRMESQQTLSLALHNLQGATEAKLESIRGEVDKKLSETINKNFQSFDVVSKRLQELQAVTGQVVNLSQGVRDLSRILESPKLRGAMGEFQLGEMLKEILPSDAYEEQFPIEGRSKEAVDAVIKLKEGFLCIDSKFPLNNARLLFESDTQTPEALKPLRKAFYQDVKVMADSIAAKYIIPDKTLDFALMFIPAESVYYELLKDSELHHYCLKKHVIPVSPNSFYAYLQAIAVGFRGLKIQAEAKKIESTIMRLRGDFQKFRLDFGKVGKHLKDAQTQYENVEDRVEKFETVIDKLGLETREKLPESLPPAAQINQ